MAAKNHENSPAFAIWQQFFYFTRWKFRKEASLFLLQLNADLFSVSLKA
jgi:hypothetical protein